MPPAPPPSSPAAPPPPQRSDEFSAFPFSFLGWGGCDSGGCSPEPPALPPLPTHRIIHCWGLRSAAPSSPRSPPPPARGTEGIPCPTPQPATFVPRGGRCPGTAPGGELGYSSGRRRLSGLGAGGSGQGRVAVTVAEPPAGSALASPQRAAPAEPPQGRAGGTGERRRAESASPASSEGLWGVRPFPSAGATPRRRPVAGQSPAPARARFPLPVVLPLLGALRASGSEASGAAGEVGSREKKPGELSHCLPGCSPASPPPPPPPPLGVMSLPCSASRVIFRGLLRRWGMPAAFGGGCDGEAAGESLPLPSPSRCR